MYWKYIILVGVMIASAFFSHVFFIHSLDNTNKDPRTGKPRGAEYWFR